MTGGITGRVLSKEDIGGIISAMNKGEIWCPKESPFSKVSIEDKGGDSSPQKSSVRPLEDLITRFDHRQNDIWCEHVAPITAYDQEEFRKHRDWKIPESLSAEGGNPWGDGFQPVDAHALAALVRQIAADLADPSGVKQKRFSPFARKGISLAGLWIVGELDLYNISLPIPLCFRACRIDGRLLLRHGAVRTLDLRGTFVRCLDARRATIGGDVHLDSASIVDGADFSGADIEGRINLNQTNLKCRKPKEVISDLGYQPNDETADAIALDMNGIRVRQSVTMSKLYAMGCLVLDNAILGSKLLVREVNVLARQPRDKDEPERVHKRSYESCSEVFYRGYAVKAHDMAVDGSVEVTLSTFDGEVRIPSINCNGAVHFQQTCIKGSAGRSLLLDFAEVQDDILLRGLCAEGAIRIRKATIRGDLICSDKYGDPGTTDTGQSAGTHDCAAAAKPQANRSMPFRVIAGTERPWEKSEIRAFGPIRELALILEGASIGGNFELSGTAHEVADINGIVNLSNVVVARKFRIAHCQIHRRVARKHERDFLLQAPFLSVGADLRVEGVFIEGTADFQDTQIRGSVAFLSSWTDTNGHHGGAVEKSDMEKTGEGGYPKARPTLVLGDGPRGLLFRRADIGGDFRLDRHERDTGSEKAFVMFGCVNFANARIGGQVVLGSGSCFAKLFGQPQEGDTEQGAPQLEDSGRSKDRSKRVYNAINGRSAKIERGILIARGFTAAGQVRFIEAKINDDVIFRDSRVSIDPDYAPVEPFAVRFDRADIDGDLVFGEPVDQDGAIQPDGSHTPSDGTTAHDNHLYNDTGDGARFQVRGGLSLTGARIDGTLALRSTSISCLYVNARSAGRHARPSWPAVTQAWSFCVWDGLADVFSRWRVWPSKPERRLKPLDLKEHPESSGELIEISQACLAIQNALGQCNNNESREGSAHESSENDIVFSAIEARLITISKDLIFGLGSRRESKNGQNDVNNSQESQKGFLNACPWGPPKFTSFVHGQIDFAAAQIEGEFLISQLMHAGPRPQNLLPKNAFIGSSIKVGLDLDLDMSVFIGGVNFEQSHIGGSGHLDNCSFIPFDLLYADEFRFGERHYNPNQIDSGETGLSFLQARFDRSLKIRRSVQIFGVGNISALTVGHDFEFWLMCLKDLHGPVTEQHDGYTWARLTSLVRGRPRGIETCENRDNRSCLLSQFQSTCKYAERFLRGNGCWIDEVAKKIKEPSLLAANRATIGGTFFLGFSADEQDREVTPSTNLENQQGPSEEQLHELDRNEGGFLDFTDMLVHTLRDSEKSWPHKKRLIINGFYYDRIDEFSKAVPFHPKKRLDWLEIAQYKTRDYHTQNEKNISSRSRVTDAVYDQLSSSYLRSGHHEHAERIDKRKRINKFWEMTILALPRYFSIAWPEKESDGTWRTPRPWSSGDDTLWIRIANAFQRMIIRFLVIVDYLLVPIDIILRSLLYIVYVLLLDVGYQKWRAPSFLLILLILGYLFTESIGPQPVAPGSPRAGQIENLIAGAHGADADSGKAPIEPTDFEPTDFVYSCIVPDPDNLFANVLVQDAKDVREGRSFLAQQRSLLNAGFFPRIEGYPEVHSLRFMIDSVVPLDLGLEKYWILSTAEACTHRPLPSLFPEGLRSSIPDWLIPDWSISDWSISVPAVFYVISAAGSVLLGIILATASGLVRAIVHPPQLPSRFGQTPPD